VPGVECGPRVFDVRHVGDGPVTQPLDDREQAAPDIGQRVLDAWRRLVEDPAVYKSGALQVAEVWVSIFWFFARSCGLRRVMAWAVWRL